MQLIYLLAENMQHFSLPVRRKLRRISQVEKTHDINPMSKDSLAIAEESLPLFLTSSAPALPPREGHVLICYVLGERLISFSSYCRFCYFEEESCYSS